MFLDEASDSVLCTVPMIGAEVNCVVIKIDLPLVLTEVSGSVRINLMGIGSGCFGPRIRLLITKNPTL